MYLCELKLKNEDAGILEEITKQHNDRRTFNR